jgi:hypothetical protein
MKALLLVLALASAAGAQTLSVEIAGDDASHVLAISARDCTALDLVARVAGLTGARLRVDPAILDDLASRTVTVVRARILVDELAALLGAKLGLRARFEEGAFVLTPASAAKPAAAAALAQVEHAILAHPEPQLMAALRHQRACLLLDAGAPAEAAVAFTDLVREFPSHSAAVEARILAVVGFLRAGRHAEALFALGELEQSRHGIPKTPGAELLPARVHAAAGNWNEALVRARKTAASGQSERDRVLAGLMAAEIQQKLGDGEGMLASVHGLPAGFDRTFRDLAPAAEHATGAALKLLKDERAALVHLRVAFRTVAPRLRPGVACTIAECFAALDEPVPALLAVRQAEAIETDEPELRVIRARRAELEECSGALASATETCLGVLKTATGPFPESERVLATLARCLIASDRTAEARVTLEALADREAWRGWALFRLAWLERGAGDAEKALRALGRLSSADLKPPGPAPDAVRKLRGDLLIELGDPLQAADVFRGASEEAPR